MMGRAAGAPLLVLLRMHRPRTTATLLCGSSGARCSTRRAYVPAGRQAAPPDDADEAGVRAVGHGARQERLAGAWATAQGEGTRHPHYHASCHERSSAPSPHAAVCAPGCHSLRSRRPVRGAPAAAASPGGPYMSTPLGGSMPSCTNFSGCSMGSSTTCTGTLCTHGSGQQFDAALTGTRAAGAKEKSGAPGLRNAARGRAAHLAHLVHLLLAAANVAVRHIGLLLDLR